MAKVLNERMPRLKVALLEQRPAPNQKHKARGNTNRFPSPRSYALSPRSLDLLGGELVEKLDCGYYDTMQIWEQDSAGMLVFF